MKSTLITLALAFASTAFAAPAVNEKRGFCLSTHEATTIVNKYKSILEGATYNGQSPNVTANQVIAANYEEFSDSILSLEQAPLGNNTPSATSRQQWLSEVLQYPDVGIETLDILHSCNKIMWHWNFPHVASSQYEVKGFNLLTVNSQCQVVEAQIEFNSIAWGLDTQQIYEYCPTSGSSSNSTSGGPPASSGAATATSQATSITAPATSQATSVASATSTA